MRVGGEGEGWSRFPEPSWTVTEMGGSRVRNLEEGKRERRKEERKKGTVERREKMISIMLLDFSITGSPFHIHGSAAAWASVW